MRKGRESRDPTFKIASGTRNSAALVFNHKYQPGDRIIFGGLQRLAVRLDENMPECVVYLPNSDRQNASYEIPYGREEKQTGSAYRAGKFCWRIPSGGSSRLEQA